MRLNSTKEKLIELLGEEKKIHLRTRWAETEFKQGTRTEASYYECKIEAFEALTDLYKEYRRNLNE